MSAQRLRVWFTKGDRVRYISHLDVLRYWERAIRRAELPLAYSQGFTPHPKIAFAGPLPLGFTSEAELMDITLDERVDPAEFRERLTRETSADLALTGVSEVALAAPSPQSVVIWADYRVTLPDVDPGEAAVAVREFLARDSFPCTVEKGDRTKTYDLRPAVATLSASAGETGTVLKMRVSAHQDMTARPEHVVEALFPGAVAADIVRTGLVLDETSAARDAWRRKGQYEG
ncbi:MAG: DUF2344 domain-containing protein [Chloroflexi bacterium]|nr:DUF2344 domain-containing protein [Chloroflexota bacterium]